MSLVTLGLFSYTDAGFIGAIYLMVGHGIVSAALFFCIGVLYDRYGTRLLHYYSGLMTVMPVFSLFMFIFSFANMSFPGTCNFIGEIAILQGLMLCDPTILLLILISTFMSAVYSLLAVNKLFFGTLKTKYIAHFTDLTEREFVILFYLFLLMLVLGFTDRAVVSLLSSSLVVVL
jgi:NADH-quinone oxidoreductase subunit M